MGDGYYGGWLLSPKRCYDYHQKGVMISTECYSYEDQLRKSEAINRRFPNISRTGGVIPKVTKHRISIPGSYIEEVRTLRAGPRIF
jgi:hypothetical protein